MVIQPSTTPQRRIVAEPSAGLAESSAPAAVVSEEPGSTKITPKKRASKDKGARVKKSRSETTPAAASTPPPAPSLVEVFEASSAEEQLQLQQHLDARRRESMLDTGSQICLRPMLRVREHEVTISGGPSFYLRLRGDLPQGDSASLDLSLLELLHGPAGMHSPLSE